MNNAATFNLLKFVERRPFLSVRKIFGVFILSAILLLGYFLLQKNRIETEIQTSSKTELTLNELTQTLQPLQQQGANNALVGVLSSHFSLSEQGFYPEFEALTHIHVEGLWLERVIIQRDPFFIKITGAMDSPDKLDQLLKQLALQPAFKNVAFIGTGVAKGLLADVPEKYKKEIDQLKMPVLYHFILQTTLLKTSEVSA